MTKHEHRPDRTASASEGSAARHSGHTHGFAPNADIRYLTIALVLIVAFMTFEVIAAFVAGSLALL